MKIEQISLGESLIDDKIKERWRYIETLENVFRYKLNVEKSKILSGKFNFLVEYNPERITLRRKPQNITAIVPTFNENEFNFNKIDEKEILFILELKHSATKITFLINNSPLTKFHTLLVPNLEGNQPQILTREAMAFAVELLQHLADKNFRIGYNSPGALASVNHLHLHLMHIEQRLFVEDVELHHLVKHIYRICDEYPSKGFCFLLSEAMAETEEILCDIAKLIEYFCLKSIPHNLFCTYGSAIDGNGKIMKIFVFPRNKMDSVKEFNSFNVAFCELSGYIPTGNAETFQEITEELVADKILEICGNIATEIETDVIKLY